MSTLRTKWNDLLAYSVGLATITFIVLCAAALLFVVGVAVVIAKISLFIK